MASSFDFIILLLPFISFFGVGGGGGGGWGEGAFVPRIFKKVLIDLQECLIRKDTRPVCVQSLPWIEGHPMDCFSGISDLLASQVT